MSKNSDKSYFSTQSITTYIVFILLVSTVISMIIIFLANDLFAFVKDDKKIYVDIPEHASISQVSKILDKKGVISYGMFFDIFVSMTVDDPVFISGTHELNSKMDYRAVLTVLRLNTSAKNVVKITIPEGYTLDQIVGTLVSNKVSTREELLDTANTYKFKHEFLKDVPMRERRLEGYLFPDTYEFYQNDDTVQVFNKMLNNFDKKFTREFHDRAEDLGFSIREVITLASLIEREAKLDDERIRVSGVIHNRLNSRDYPYLQIDATIQYAIGHTDPLTKQELNIDSPYNTYKYKGLPEGPIACPGYDSIYAALNPEKHNYYFYVAKDDGSHIFSKTLKDHNRAVASVRKK